MYEHFWFQERPFLNIKCKVVFIPPSNISFLQKKNVKFVVIKWQLLAPKMFTCQNASSYVHGIVVMYSRPSKTFQKENPLTHLCSMGNYTFKMCKSNGIYFEYLCKKLFFFKKKSYNTVFQQPMGIPYSALVNDKTIKYSQTYCLYLAVDQ